MRIVCQQTILMNYHTLFVIFEKAANFLIVAVGALRVKRISHDLVYLECNGGRDLKRDMFLKL